MKLSQTQIQELYNFTRRRRVEFYDLQTELVDHLANGIEKQWMDDSELSFTEALKIEFSKFGHFGFGSILKSRKKAMNKKYNRIIYNEYRRYFSWPKIIKIVVASAVFLTLIRLLPLQYKWMIVSVGVIPFVSYLIYVAYKKQKAYKNKIGIEKRWLLQEKIFTISGTAAGAMNLFHIFNLLSVLNLVSNNFWFDAFMSILVVCSFTLCYVIIFVIPEKAEQYLSMAYPEYTLVSKKWR